MRMLGIIAKREDKEPLQKMLVGTGCSVKCEKYGKDFYIECLWHTETQRDKANKIMGDYLERQEGEK